MAGSVGVEVAVSSNDTIDDLNGFAITTGGSIDAKAWIFNELGAEVNIPIASSAHPSYTIFAGYGFGGNFVETHAYLTYTYVEPLIGTSEHPKFNPFPPPFGEYRTKFKDEFLKDFQTTFPKISNLFKDDLEKSFDLLQEKQKKQYQNEVNNAIEIFKNDEI